MNHFVKLAGLLFLPSIITGCGDNPSTKYPEQTIFQHIDIIATQDSIKAKSEYYSNDVIYFSSENEKQFLTINSDKKFELNVQRSSLADSHHNFTTYIDKSQLESRLLSGDQFAVIFERSNGNTLESSASLPAFIQFITPIEAQQIDHSSEDLIIEWDLASAKENALYLQGECLVDTYPYDFKDISGPNFDITLGQTSLTIAANSLQINTWYEQETCEVTAHFFNESTGLVDENFAGGTYKISSHSTRKFTLTNLQAGN
ncbi:MULTISPECIES: hypothetical protein [unclassified Pseudoalteromonas]|uniref:hypothetical protein n=1 Tax=unclassified Pseudoalteromonas TaxID=194690 RepID=UPI0005AB04A5|nr:MULTISPECIES: hypothetical protein [unclassified Pseudoalteromonas]